MIVDYGGITVDYTDDEMNRLEKMRKRQIRTDNRRPGESDTLRNDPLLNELRKQFSWDGI